MIVSLFANQKQLIMGLKDSLKRLFSTSKTVGAQKVEQSIEQVIEFTKGNSEKADEVIGQTKENIREFARETSEKAKDLGEKIQGKAEEAKDQIEAKVEEAWAKFEEKAVFVVDNLEAKIRGAKPEEEVVAEPAAIETPDEVVIPKPKRKPKAPKP